MEFEIKPQSKFSLGIKELWAYRELFYFFTWRDIKVKYKQTVFGFLWAVLQPLFMTIVFTVFVSESIVQKTQLSIPYPLFALSGMLLWTIFSGGMSNAANSMVSNANIIKKIYFPRLIIPISSILVSLVDFCIAFIVFIVVLFIFKAEVHYRAFIFLPLSLLITCLSAMGCGIFLAALNIKYRDVRYALPFFIQGLLFLSPVLYPVNISNNLTAQFILKLNPLAGALELMRGLFTGYCINYEIVWISFFTSMCLFIIGVIYFRKTEGYFADLA